MADDNNGTFDHESFKREIADTNRQFGENLIASVRTEVSKLLENTGGRRSSSDDNDGSDYPDDIRDLQDEMESLGLNKKQSADFLKAVVNIVQKQAPKIEEKVAGTVDKNLEFKQKRAEANQNAVRDYPAALDETSALGKRARQIFSGFSDAVKVAYDSNANAIKLAAAELGIKPVSLEDAAALAAANPTGGGEGGYGRKKGNEPDDDQLAFAKMFNVKPDDFKRHLKAV